MRSYYLFFQGAKSANMVIFKDFCNAEKTNGAALTETNKNNYEPR
jgi:hypothetical protein